MKAPVLSALFGRRELAAAPPDVAAAALRSDRFRLEREQEWERLDAVLTRIEKGRLRGLSDEDVIALPALYRDALAVMVWDKSRV